MISVSCGHNWRNNLKTIISSRRRAHGIVGSTNYYYTKDHLGSIREVLDLSTRLVSRYAYDPWGKQLGLVQGFKPTFGFAGYFVHPPSDLNLAVFRALSTDAGRWISRDPLQELGGLNLYAYVGR